MRQLDCNSHQNSLVVVVTVCKNDLFGLKMVVESVRSNCYAPLQHIVIDCSSTDGTAAYLCENSSQFAYALSEPDEGIYDGMNKAIDQCPADAWVIFLNTGDRFHSNNVLMDLDNYLKADNDFIFGAVSVRDGAGSIVYNVKPHSMTGMPSCHQSTLIRSNMLKLLKFDTSYKVGADFDFFLRATCGSPRKVAYIKHVIAEIAPEGYSARNERILQQDYVRTISHHLGRFFAYQWLFRRNIGRALRRLRIIAKG